METALTARSTRAQANPDQDHATLRRDQVAPENTWDLSIIFPDDRSWETERDALIAEIPGLDRFRGRLADADTLREALDTLMLVHHRLERLGHYASRRRDEDLARSEPAAMSDAVTKLGSELRAATAYFDPEVLTIDEAVLRAWMQDPRFADYDRHLHRLLEQKDHVLGPAEERVLANASTLAPVLYHTYSTFADAELERPVVTMSDGAEVEINATNYRTYRQSAVREDRRRAFEAQWDLYGKYKSTFANMLSGQVAYYSFVARSRNHDSVLHMALHENEIPVPFYATLIDRVSEHLGSFHRYLGLRKTMLGIEGEQHYHDVYPSLVPAARRRYGIEESRALAIAAARPLGTDYTRRMEKALAEGAGWLDVYPNKGKRSGAYMAGCYGLHPLVLLNHNNDFESLSTLVHEMGHAMHSVLSQEAQPYPKADYSIFVAEVASTLNEALLVEHLLREETDPGFRRFLLAEYLHGFRGTVFRQTMFAEFEREIYARSERREALTGDALNEIYLALLRRYHGHDQGVMQIDERYAAEWSYIPHFYYQFYVYQYTSSFIASAALAERILSEGAPAAERYVNALLRGGCAQDPMTILREAGVDLETKEPYEIAFKRFDRYLGELEKLAN